MHSPRLLSTSTFALAAALALAACSKPAGQASAPAFAPTVTAALAPDAAQLPAAAAIRPASAEVVRQPYSYIDDAYAMGDAFGDAPPDYTVDYEGTRPLIWRADDGDYRVIEQTPDGERDYYYHAGQDQPFLVRDPRYAYAYDGGTLMVVYDASGRPLSGAIPEQDAEMAARYLGRARQLYRAAAHAQRLSAADADWQAQRNAVQAQQTQWAEAQRRNDDWRSWHDQQAGREHAAYDAERAQRQQDASRLAAMTAGAAMRRGQDQLAQDQRAQDQRAQDQAAAEQHRQQVQAQAAGQRQDALRADADRRDQAQALAQSQGRQQQQAAADQARQQRMQADQARMQQAQAQAERSRADQARAQQAQVQTARQQQAQADQARMQQVQAAHQQQQMQAQQARAQQLQAQQAHAQQAAQAGARQAQAEQARRVPTPPPAPVVHNAGKPPPAPTGKPDDKHEHQP